MVSKITRNEKNEVRRMLGNYEIHDAKEPFSLYVNGIDIKNAVPGDPKNCALANSAMRWSGEETGIAIYRKRAYILMNKGNGVKVIERFSPDKDTVEAIRKFDTTGVFNEGRYFFNPPSKSVGLNSIRKRSAAHRAKVKILGKMFARGIVLSGSKPIRAGWLGVRNGTGAVHFPVSKEASA